MDQDRDRGGDEATSVDEPSGWSADEDLPYDPVVTDPDEANVPKDSDADEET